VTIYDHLTHTIRPLDAEGDRHFGLEPGTNGTAAECRREAVAPRGIGVTWLRHNGRPAVGLTLRPSTRTADDGFVNPWG
jgi:hypothetical protein